MSACVLDDHRVAFEMTTAMLPLVNLTHNATALLSPLRRLSIHAAAKASRHAQSSSSSAYREVQVENEVHQ